MAGMQENPTILGSMGRELLSTSIYKRNQGRVTRQVTGAVLALVWAVGCWQLWQILPMWLGAGGPMSLGMPSETLNGIRWGLPFLLAALGLWMAYRIVNIPQFAEFLIGVESEMAKVAWPTIGDVARSSAVVIFMIFALSFILAAYDLFWWLVLGAIQGFR
jgi:preprotein translocase subunit SecE